MNVAQRAVLQIGYFVLGEAAIRADLVHCGKPSIGQETIQHLWKYLFPSIGVRYGGIKQRVIA